MTPRGRIVLGPLRLGQCKVCGAASSRPEFAASCEWLHAISLDLRLALARHADELEYSDWQKTRFWAEVERN